MPLYWVETPMPGRLAVAARPRGGDWLGDEVRSLMREGVEILISLLTRQEAEELGLAQESKECELAKLAFLNFPIADRSLPHAERAFAGLVDRLVRELNQGKAIAVHCRVGMGRSVVLVACILVRCGVAPADALKRIQAARRCPIPDTEEQVNFIHRFAAG